jgi:UDP-glucose 4-epimerase
MRKKIAVTGSGGFIGQYVEKVIVDNGDDFIPFDRVDGHNVLGSLRGLEGASTVIHLAGMLGTAELFDLPERAVEENVIGTLRILEWCRDNGGGFVGITMPDSSWANVYQATKLCAMRLATAWHRNMGVPVAHVRAFNAYGPGQKHGDLHPQKIIPTFAYHAWRGSPIPIWGDGKQTVDLVHVQDVAQMLYQATRFGDDEVFDAGTGVSMPVNMVAALVNMVTGNEAGVTYYPMRAGEEPNSHIAARGEGWHRIGWTPTLDINLLAETVRSYKPS